MSIRIVRLGENRTDGEGLRVGTVRRPPRGVKKSEYSSRNLYDVWFPNLSPSEELLKSTFPVESDKEWKKFKRRFLAELKNPERKRELELLAALSISSNFSIGCYCEEESLCHRSILKEELEKLGAKLNSSLEIAPNTYEPFSSQ